MNANDILKTNIATGCLTLAEKLMQSAQYTTLALWSLAQAQRDLDDDEGAARIEAFAKTFAEYEASTL